MRFSVLQVPVKPGAKNFFCDVQEGEFSREFFGYHQRSPALTTGLFGFRTSDSLAGDYVCRTWAFFALSDFKLDLLALVE